MAVGTRVNVLQLFKMPDGSIKALVEGLERVRIERFEAHEPHFVVSYTPLSSPDRRAARSRTLARRVTAQFASYVQLNPQLGDEAAVRGGPDRRPGRAGRHRGRRTCRSPAKRSRRCWR